MGKGRIAYIMLFDACAGASHSCSLKNRNEKEIFYNSGNHYSYLYYICISISIIVFL
jgi:3-methyladenine DNA glycosylase Mpg